MIPTRPSFTGSDYHSRRTRKVVQAQLVPAGSGYTGRAPWLPVWVPLFALATLLGAATMAWWQGSTARQERVFAELMRYRPHHADQESPEARQLRLWAVAGAIVASGRGQRELEAALITVAKHESNFSELVGAGRCDELPRGENCDGGRARLYWQTHRQNCEALWTVDEASPEALAIAAECASRRLRWARARCLDSGWAGMFAGYNVGKCAEPWAAEREATFRAVLARM